MQAILEPTPAEAEAQAAAPGDGKDLTLALRDLRLRQDDLPVAERAAARKALSRPPGNTVRAFGNVRVHYQAGDPTVSATLVNQVGSVVTHVLAQYRAAGYRAPRADGTAGGDSGLDIYLGDLGIGLYGYCSTDRPPPVRGPHATSAYCAFNSDYSWAPRTPLDNLKVTAAHELFHATQFAYDYYEDAWFMEATATWAEDEVYDTINDNRQYLASSPLSQPRESLDQFNGNNLRQYGEWIFFRYLSERFPRSQGGLPVIVRSIWQRADSTRGAAADLYSIQAVNRDLRLRGTDLRRMYAAFGDANRRPSQSYEEGAAYRKAAAARVWTFTPSRRTTGLQGTRLNHLATTTVAVLPSRAMKSYRLRVSVNLPNTSRGVAAVLTKYDKAGQATRQMIRLSKSGNGAAALRFDSRNTLKVELTLSNAGIRYRCGTGPRNGTSSSPAPASRGTTAARCATGSQRSADSRCSACRTTAGSVVVHIGGRLALRKLP